ncbi:MAG: PEP/pyruvate-binding domain-containing protein [Desulfovibrionaceae bacterium]
MGSAFVAIRDFLRRAGGGRPTEERLEELRADYRSRCRSFRLLIKANHEALAAMAGLEELARGTSPFGMARIRYLCVRALAAGFQMIKQLDRMAPGTYSELYESFGAIQRQVHEAVANRGTAPAGENVLPLEALGLEHTPETGGKMSSLGEARRKLGLTIPRGFVITASAFRRFMAHNELQEEIDRLVQTSETDDMQGLYALSSAIAACVQRAEIPEDLVRDVETALAHIQSGMAVPLRLAVRSSALGEDVSGASFAGQYHSELNVAPDNLLEAYKDVVASKYSVTAMAYRFNRGIRDEDVAMCVGCMEMIPALAGGVLYTRDPMNPDSSLALLTAMPGLPKSIVDGSADCDRYFVAREGRVVVSREIAEKRTKVVCDLDEGTLSRVILESERHDPAVSDTLASAVTGIGLRLEKLFGAPQDVEWAVREDKAIILLQCRALHLAAADSDERVEESAFAETNSVVSTDASPLLQGGVSASPGAAAGPVHLVRTDADALRFPDQAVLAANNALPRWAPLLPRASAVVTEHGAAAGHLASVAREYSVPALLGVNGALSVLADAGVVTVDADKRAIYPGRIEHLLHRKPKPDLMHGSAVSLTLHRALEHISPLHLTDPSAASFVPQSCRTIHDILRYCHEMGVQEMFCREQQGNLHKGLSRRLVVGVPQQYWIVDLAEGLRPGRDGERTVDLEDVLCVPMRILWQGMQAVIWQGPPPVDGKGLLSVMVQATSDPALAEGAASPYAVRNYFLITKDYCSLQSRFGFHFSTVEACLTDDAEENYIIFQFKGGAADLDRRVRRAKLVSDVLEERGFIVELREDAVHARIEGVEKPRMQQLLKIVGYLVIHTRQLDMVMANPEESARQGAKIRRDLAAIAAKDAGIPPPSRSGAAKEG